MTPMTPMTPTVSGVIYKVEDTLFVVKDFSDLIQKHIATRGFWEPDIINILRSLARQITEQCGKCHLVNVGAHIGSVSIPCANSFSRVTAFEPVRSTFEHLNLHCALNQIKHMKTYNLALSDFEHSARVVFDRKNTGGCHVVSDFEFQHNIRHARHCADDHNVNCVAMDSITFDDTIEVLLVDIEGHEERFIKGAEQTLKKHLPVLIIELWTDSKRQYENMTTTQKEMIQKITSFGYKTVKKLGVDTFIFHQ